MERHISLRPIVFFFVLASTLLFSVIAGSLDSKPSASNSSFVSANNLDIDGNGDVDALTDGLLILRYLFGYSGESLVISVLSDDAVYIEADQVENRISSLGNKLDIDGNNDVDALTDGLLVLRYLFGYSGQSLITNVLSSNADRTQASEIEAYLSQLTILNAPPSFISSSSFSADENQ